MAGSDSVSASEEKGGITIDNSPPTFTIDALLEEIANQLSTTADGQTTREICDGLGLPTTDRNLNKVWHTVRNMIALGQAEYAGKKQARTIEGHHHRVASWRLKAEVTLEGSNPGG